MARSRYFSRLLILFISCVLVFNLTAYTTAPQTASATATAKVFKTGTSRPTLTRTLTHTRTPTITLTPIPSLTPTPVVQADAEPSAWVDGDIRLDQFPAKGALVIHFNTPMQPESSAHPLLTWPDVAGTSTWSQDNTILTFTPSAALATQKSYTFFLDPGLQSLSGKELKEAPEWIVHIQNGLRVVSVQPASGILNATTYILTVTFDRDMDQTLSDFAFSIKPDLPFETRWKSTKVFEIRLDEALKRGERYDLTLSGLQAADGTSAEDYRWFYTVPSLGTMLKVQGQTLRVEFTEAMDKDKSGLPFSISPALEGEWVWVSSILAKFTSSEIIPASTEYSLSLTAPLVDENGMVVNIAPQTFIGETPIHLLDIKRDSYDDQLHIPNDQKEITIHFDTLVDHASAEKAFSLKPAVTGTITWNTAESGEDLVYTFNELLQSSYINSKPYTLQIDSTITDRQGKRLLVNPYKEILIPSYNYYSSPSFGEYGDNIQVVDSNGPRKLQFQESTSEENMDFAAYRFDLIDYAKVYADHYGFRRTRIYDIPIPAGLQATAIWSGTAERKINEDASVTETTLPNTVVPGLYILNLRVGGIVRDQLFLVVTRNTLVVKNDGENLFVWLTDINGGNVSGAEIRVYSKTGEKIREGQTNAEGQYRVSIPLGTEPMLVSARVRVQGQPEDVTLAGFAGWYTTTRYYNDDYDNYYVSERLPQGQPYMIYGYTDRPIYRPGQQVNFKVLVRKDNDVRYEVPPVNTLVNVSVMDARQNVVETFDLHTNQFGTVNGVFTLTDGAMLGDYTVYAELNEISDSVSFKVEDYRKPDYEIKITSLEPEKKNQFVQGDKVKLKVNTSYYFGEPLAKARLNFKFYGDEYYEPKSANLLIDGSSVTDENGEASISFEAPYNKDYCYYYCYQAGHQTRLEITVDDGSNQFVAATYAFSVFPAAEQLTLNTGGYYANPGKPFMVTAHVKQLDGLPVAGRKLTLSIARLNRSTYEFERLPEHFELQTDAQGNAMQGLELGSDYYHLTIDGRDAFGNSIETTRSLYVFKDGMEWFQRTRNNRLSISAEKDTYKPYEKARFAIESSFSGPALLTFERGSVINTKLVQLTAPLTMIETDVIPEYAPNIYVLVNAWEAGGDLPEYGFSSISDSTLRLARTQITVDSSTKALDINIQTDKKTYAPGDKVSTIIQVNDADGKPAQAEISLAVVDESIFALADDTSGDIFDVFYGPRRHNVDTSDSMTPSRYLAPMLGGGGGGAVLQGARSDFLDTSAWFPAIETDANGKATVTFDLPDNTTSWRLTVRAITLNHKVGQAQVNVETKKEVFVRPSLPRVLTSGDQATLTAFVHNYGATMQTVNVNFAADGLDVQGPNDQQITLQPGDVQPVGWRVLVSGANPTEVTIAVTGADGPLDAVRLPLLIQPSAVRDLKNQAGSFQRELTLGLPLPKVERRTSQVTLTLNRSMAGTLMNGLEYLTGYPYGCVEQTMSRALPNAVVGRAANQLGVGGPALEAKVGPLIKASIQRLYGLQHYDGGWGWWTDDRTDAYQTAWVLFGLGLMNDSGYTIDTDVMDRAAEWLKQNELSSYNDESDIRTQAYALFSMAEAGRGEKEQTLALAKTSARELDPFSQAALALALERLGEREQAQAIMALLSQSAFTKDDQVYWPQPSYDGEYHNKTMASTLRTTALVLLAYTRIEPQNALIPGMVTYLAEQRQGIYGWGTTNETSFTILALTEYLKSQQDAATTIQYEVFVNEKSLSQGALAVGNTNVVLQIPMAELNDGVNSLRVTTQNDQLLYYDLSTRYDLLQTNGHAAGKIAIQRFYLDPATNHPLTELKAGQLVKVIVEVNVPENTSFMAVEDYLPGGLEALNEGLNTVTVGYPYYQYDSYDFSQYYWEKYGYNYKEIRGDRVVFFITTFNEGFRRFTYFARATTTGEFTILPAQAYAMYDLSMWGRSDGAKILVK